MSRPAEYGADQRVQLTATYLATDGSMPEQIEVEWAGRTFPPVNEIAIVVEALARAAHRRPPA